MGTPAPRTRQGTGRAGRRISAQREFVGLVGEATASRAVSIASAARPRDGDDPPPDDPPADLPLLEPRPRLDRSRGGGLLVSTLRPPRRAPRRSAGPGRCLNQAERTCPRRSGPPARPRPGRPRAGSIGTPTCVSPARERAAELLEDRPRVRTPHGPVPSNSPRSATSPDGAEHVRLQRARGVLPTRGSRRTWRARPRPAWGRRGGSCTGCPPPAPPRCGCRRRGHVRSPRAPSARPRRALPPAAAQTRAVATTGRDRPRRRAACKIDRTRRGRDIPGVRVGARQLLVQTRSRRPSARRTFVAGGLRFRKRAVRALCRPRRVARLSLAPEPARGSLQSAGVARGQGGGTAEQACGRASCPRARERAARRQVGGRVAADSAGGRIGRGQGRHGSDTPARGGSRGSRPARRGAACSVSQAANCSWSAARTVLGIPA